MQKLKLYNIYNNNDNNNNNTNKYIYSGNYSSPEANCQKALVKKFAYPVSPTDKFGTIM